MYGAKADVRFILKSGEVVGSIPTAPTREKPNNQRLYSSAGNSTRQLMWLKVVEQMLNAIAQGGENPGNLFAVR
jgi:hypothetical protein